MGARARTRRNKRVQGDPGDPDTDEQMNSVPRPQGVSTIKQSEMEKPIKRQMDTKTSNFLQIPVKRSRLSVQNSDDDSDLKVNLQDRGKLERSGSESVFGDSGDENCPDRRFGLSPPSPGLMWDAGFVLDSPTRHILQRDASTLPATIRKLGKGGFGTVVLGSWQSRRVAVKILGRTNRALLQRELNAEKLNHSNIVKIFKVFYADEVALENNTLVVMEYVGHYNLMSIIQTQPEKLTQPFIVRAAIQMCKALEHCYNHGIVHLDFKPANVLVIKDHQSSCPVFKLADFGCSTNIKLEGNKITEAVGTPGYQAPEIFRRKVSEKCDIYSFGITLWQLLTKQSVIYPDLHPHTIIFKLAHFLESPWTRVVRQLWRQWITFKFGELFEKLVTSVSLLLLLGK